MALDIYKHADGTDRYAYGVYTKRQGHTKYTRFTLHSDPAYALAIAKESPYPAFVWNTVTDAVVFQNAESVQLGIYAEELDWSFPPQLTKKYEPFPEEDRDTLIRWYLPEQANRIVPGVITAEKMVLDNVRKIDTDRSDEPRIQNAKFPTLKLDTWPRRHEDIAEESLRAKSIRIPREDIDTGTLIADKITAPPPTDKLIKDKIAEVDAIWAKQPIYLGMKPMYDQRTLAGVAFISFIAGTAFAICIALAITGWSPL